MKRRLIVGCAIAALEISTGCASRRSHQTLPASPYPYLVLEECRDFRGFAECLLTSLTSSGPVSFGPVQIAQVRARTVSRQYQVAYCTPVLRIVQPLPNYVCQISNRHSGMYVGHILVKGGTAVRLAKSLGDLSQRFYRRTRDPWSRVGE